MWYCLRDQKGDPTSDTLRLMETFLNLSNLSTVLFEHERSWCRSVIETFTLPIGRMKVKLRG